MEPDALVRELEDVLAVIRRADDVDDLGPAEAKLRDVVYRTEAARRKRAARSAYSSHGLTTI